MCLESTDNKKKKAKKSQHVVKIRNRKKSRDIRTNKRIEAKEGCNKIEGSMKSKTCLYFFFLIISSPEMQSDMHVAGLLFNYTPCFWQMITEVTLTRNEQCSSPMKCSLKMRHKDCVWIVPQGSYSSYLL